MFKKFFFRKSKQKPSYIGKVDSFTYLDIIRLKGPMDYTVIPLIEDRIQRDRAQGGTIDKNILLDFKNVEKIDSSAIAFHVARLKEFQAKQYKLAFINLSQEYQDMLSIFKQDEIFMIYDDEEKAVLELNKSWF